MEILDTAILDVCKSGSLPFFITQPNLFINIKIQYYSSTFLRCSGLNPLSLPLHLLFCIFLGFKNAILGFAEFQ